MSHTDSHWAIATRPPSNKQTKKKGAKGQSQKGREERLCKVSQIDGHCGVVELLPFKQTQRSMDRKGTDRVGREREGDDDKAYVLAENKGMRTRKKTLDQKERSSNIRRMREKETAQRGNQKKDKKEEDKPV